MMDRPVTFGPETARRLLTLLGPEEPSESRGQTRRRSVDTYFVKVTSLTTVSSRYPGMRYSFDALSNTYTAQDTVWVVEPNGDVPALVTYYRATRAGQAGTPSRPVWIIELAQALPAIRSINLDATADQTIASADSTVGVVTTSGNTDLSARVATNLVSGIVSIFAQLIAGIKTFLDPVQVLTASNQTLSLSTSQAATIGLNESLAPGTNATAKIVVTGLSGAGFTTSCAAYLLPPFLVSHAVANETTFMLSGQRAIDDDGTTVISSLAPRFAIHTSAGGGSGTIYNGAWGTDSTGNVISGGLVTTVGSASVTVTHGGTGVASATAYAVICGGTTSTGALQSVASVGTSGQVLTSNGAGTLPTFQAASAPVASVSNSDATLTISPTTGSVVASLNLASTNTWSKPQAIDTNNIVAFLVQHTSNSLGLFKIDAKTGSGQIGVFGASPAAQGIAIGTTTGFTANATANTAYNESTFTGGLGSSAYTISDVVLALKKFGWLAQ